MMLEKSKDYQSAQHASLIRTERNRTAGSAASVQSGRLRSFLMESFWGMMLLGATFSLIISELLNTLNSDLWLPPVNILVTLALILFLQILLLGVFKRLSRALIFSQLLITVLSLVNHFKQYFRGDPFFAADLMMTSTMDKVVVGLRYTPDIRFLAALLILVVAIAIATHSRRRITEPINRLLLSTVATFLIIISVIGGIWNDTVRHDWLNLSDYPWSAMTSTRENGFLIPFILSIADLRAPAQPNALVAESAYRIASPVSVANPASPNVIVIMSESFSDFEQIRALKTSEPIMPFFRTLQQSPDTISGNLLVPVFGGGTSNTEFEFLTGSSMLYANDGLIPYLLYFKKPTHGLADLFNQQGYRSVAIHPYLRTYYNRQSVFSAMGFSSFISGEQFPVDTPLVRGYRSDQAHVDQIIRTFEEKTPLERLFLFTITMQNHFPYDNADTDLANLPYRIRLPDMANAQSAELFLSLLRLSDDALKNLIQYFAKVNEPTLIVVFGDHLPGLSSGFRPFYQDLFGKSIAELDLLESRKLYETPFMIWANYPLPKMQISETSPNFLSATVAELAKANLSPYYQFINDLSHDVSAISNKMLILKDGTIVDRNHIPAELTNDLKQYWNYQYDNIIRK